jgi:hypothetical protein
MYKMSKRFIFLMILMISIVISFAYANMYCPDEYCSNQYYFGDPVMTLSASNFPGYSSSTYYTCNTDPSLYSPIAVDIDDDSNVEEVIIPTSNIIEFISKVCQVSYTFTTDYPITSRPSLTNIDGQTSSDSNYQKYDLVILTNSTIDVYNSTAKKYSFNYLTLTGNKPLYALTCTDHDCWAIRQDANLTIITFTLNYDIRHQQTIYVHPRFDNGVSLSTYGYSQTVDGLSYASYCGVDIGNNIAGRCYVINQTGYVTSNLSLNWGSGAVTNLPFYQAGYVKMGNIYRYIITAKPEKTSNQSKMHVYSVFESTLTTLLNYTGNSNNTNTPYMSDVAVGDWDKDGNIEACYFTNDTVFDYNNRLSRFVCYRSGFYTASYNFTVNRSAINMTFPNHFYMVDFNSTSNNKYVATYEGIYDINPTLSRQVQASSYASSFIAAKTLNPILSYMDNTMFNPLQVKWSGMPILAYADTSVNSFMMYASNMGLYCGDGLCTTGEDMFNCPSDCLIKNVTTGACYTDLQCPVQYPKCLNYKCVAGFNSQACVDSSTCPYNASLCYNGYCVQAVYGGIDNGTIVPGTTPGTDSENLDNLWLSLFGGSRVWAFIVGMILMIVIWIKFVAGFGLQNSGQAQLIIAAFLLVLFTVLQFLPIWITLFLIILTAMLFVLSRVLKPSSEG